MAERKSGPGMHRYPYEPDMEHCRMVVKTGGATCYIMDDCCRDMTAEDKAAYAALRNALDEALAGTRLAKDRAAKCLTTIMIPEALDYPA